MVLLMLSLIMVFILKHYLVMVCMKTVMVVDNLGNNVLCIDSVKWFG